MISNNIEEIEYKDYYSSQVNQGNISIEKLISQRRPYIKHLSERFLPKDYNIKILDLGCGYGGFLFVLDELGYKNTEGVDCSSEQLEIAKKIGIKNVYNNDLLSHLKIHKDNSVDILIAFDIFEHYNIAELHELLNECCRVLNKDGKLIIHIPNGGAIFPGIVFWGDITHKTCFTTRSLSQILKKFSAVSFYEDYPIPHGIKSFIRYVLWMLFSNVFKLMYIIESGYTKDIILSQNFLAIAKK